MRPDCDILYLGGADSIEKRLASEAGIRFIGLAGRSLNTKPSFGSVLTAVSFTKGLLKSLNILRGFKPDVVAGTGGYASASVIAAQIILGGRTLLHESNIIPGRTNRWLGRYATKVTLVYEEAEKYFPKGRTSLTGNPIRPELLRLTEKAEARKSLGLDPSVFTIVVIGGSQGAATINRVVAEAVPMLRKLPVQVLHQTGKRDYEKTEAAGASEGWESYRVREYMDDMAAVYAAADLVLCRSGSTLSEITAIGLPSILVPYPHAYADHQMLNARFVESNGGGVVIKNSDLTPEVLLNTLKRFLDSPGELKNMADASKKMGRTDAAESIARLIIDTVEKER